MNLFAILPAPLVVIDTYKRPLKKQQKTKTKKTHVRIALKKTLQCSKPKGYIAFSGESTLMIVGARVKRFHSQVNNLKTTEKTK